MRSQICQMYFLCEKMMVQRLLVAFAGTLQLEKNDEIIQLTLFPDVLNNCFSKKDVVTEYAINTIKFVRRNIGF